ncbi:hypothetical protein RF11_02548 [Thelohanellus kitauei]|uniref:Uncharacterized protein n=1 Tax=Thelohanellus kitauei TaxID=669202 RepID=A0A0C2MAY3_THEKT|nr:hypothetical protein RF11_02548 [Thelohanellus kitauei]
MFCYVIGRNRQPGDKVDETSYFSFSAYGSMDIDSTLGPSEVVCLVSSSFCNPEELIGIESMKGQTTAAELFDDTLKIFCSVSMHMINLAKHRYSRNTHYKGYN